MKLHSANRILYLVVKNINESRTTAWRGSRKTSRFSGRTKAREIKKTMVIIAPITEADLFNLSLLYQQLFAKEQIVSRMKGAFKEIENNPNYLVLGAKDSDHLVGSAMGVICTDLFGECKPFMVIENVIVSSESRYKGIGKKLLQELERQAIKRNCCYALLVSSADRKEAHRFYNSLGYDMDAYRGFKKHFTSLPGAQEG